MNQMKKGLSLLIAALFVFSCFTILSVFTASAAVDIRITDITWDIQNPEAGDQITFSATLKNQGSDASPAGTIHGVRFSVGTLNNYFAWSDNYTQSIPAGGTAKVTCNGGVSGATWDALVGDQTIIAWFDDQGRIDPANETSNANNTFQKTIKVYPQGEGHSSQGGGGGDTPAPGGGTNVGNDVDLYISSVNASASTIYDGDYVTINAMVRNNSSQASEAGVAVDFSVDGTKVETGYVKEAIPANSFKIASTKVYWESYFGTHRISARANSDNYQKESDKSNNYFKARIKVLDAVNPSPVNPPVVEDKKPDLVVSEFNAPTGVKKGDKVKFSATIKNQGEGEVLGGNIKLAFKIGGNEVSSVTQSVRMLAPNATLKLTASGTWTAGTDENVTVTAQVSGVNESNTNNNTKDAQMSVEQPSTPPAGDGTVVTYPGVSSILGGDNRTVTANGKNIELFKTNVNNGRRYTTNPGFDKVSVGMFDLSGSATIEVDFKTNINSCIVRPTDKGIQASVNGTKATFTVTQVGQYSVEPNGNANDAILLFISDIYQAPSGGVEIVSAGLKDWGTGAHNISGRVSLAPGAVVRGHLVPQSGSTLEGRGIIDGSTHGVYGRDGWNAVLPIETWAANGVNISGITMLDPKGWCMQLQNSSNITLDNIKIIDAGPNSDGISIQSTSNVTIKNSFVRSWDDSIVIKNYGDPDSHDINVENCVLWTDLAQSMEIGAETNKSGRGNPRIYTVNFKNVYVIHAMHKAPISIHNCDNAVVSDITWDGIYIDDCSTGQGDGWPYVFDITNLTGSAMGGAADWTHVGARGSITCTIKNVYVRGGSSTGGRFSAREGGFTNVTMSNINLQNGKKTNTSGWTVESGATVNFQ
jgi:hypothetical protein